MSSEVGTQSLALVAPPKPTFLTLPHEITHIIYDYCGLFETREVQCWRAIFYHDHDMGKPQIQTFYVCRQISEQVLHGFYGSKWFILDMKASDFIGMIGLRNARSIRKLCVDWKMLGTGHPDFHMLRTFGDATGLRNCAGGLGGIRLIKVEIPDPWESFSNAAISDNMQAAVRLLCRIARDPRFGRLVGEKVFAGYRFLSGELSDAPRRHCWLVLKLGQGAEDRVSLRRGKLP